MAIEGLRSEGERHQPGPYAEDIGVLIAEDDFLPVYDVPFITVNRIAGRYRAEVILCGDDEIDRERIQTALDVGAEHGVRAYANVQGTYGNVLIYFSPLDEVIRAGVV